MDTPVELIAKGTFGAVVKVFDGRSHYALKIQMVGASKTNDREYEILCDLQVLEKRFMSPCVLGVKGCRRTSDLYKKLAQVSQMRQSPKDDSFVYQLVEMDLVHGPNLREYLRAHATLESSLSMSNLKGISFQLFWTTAMAIRAIKFKHRDLKPANIMLSPHTESTYGLSGKVWHTSTMLPIPIDFNLSVSQNNRSDKDWRCGTMSYMPPEKIYKIKRSADDEGFSHDPWSLGIILSSMALCGRSFGKTTPGLNVDEVFNPGKTETIYQLWFPYTERFKENLCPQLPEYDWSTIKHAVCLALFQEALGNRAFPEANSEIGRTSLCIVIKKNWRGIKATLRSCKESVLISRCPELIATQIGNDLVDLLKNLFRWEPNDRLTAEQALSHRFFSTLKVDDKIPTWHPIEESTCIKCGEYASNLCIWCQKAKYCSRECLELDWDRHVEECI